MLEHEDLASPERVEQIRRSVAMVTGPALDNHEIDRLLRALSDALAELRRLRRWCGLE